MKFLSVLALVFSSSVVLSLQSVSAQAAATSQTSSPDAAAQATSTLPPPKFFYSTEYLNGKVGGYRVDPSTGALSSTGQPPVWAHWGPTRIAADSGGYRLYVANQGSQDVSAYFIYRNDGWLYPVPGANFTVGGVSTDIAVHPSNKFVYVTTADAYATNNGAIKGKSNSVTAFSVASNGSLVPVPGSPFVTDGPNWGIAIDPSGKYLYASSQVSDKNQDGEINAFSIDQTTGALTPLPGSPFPIIPYTCPEGYTCFNWDNIYGMAIDPTGNFLIGGGTMNGVAYVYRIQAGTGSLGEVAGSPFVVALAPCSVGSCFPAAALTDVAVTPTDQYVILSSLYGVNGLAIFNFDSSTGALSNLTWSASPYNTWGTTSGIVRSDPSGKFVYTLGWVYGTTTDTGMIGFALGAKGSTTIVPGAPYPDPGLESYTMVDGIAVTP
jgi:6-phosphogluconolactonase